MDIKELTKFVEEDYKAWNDMFKHQEKSTEAFVILGKLGKKLGDLDKEVAKEFGFCHKEALKEPMCADRKLAGLVINSLLLAKVLDIDMEKAMKDKMERMREHGKK
ncbi:MAG: hypothetical protein LBL52_04005 [Rickettsiales bacterium]|jgi:hypothetical protein|nr:hypothetical protein [Rickettsiales bacterium]